MKKTFKIILVFSFIALPFIVQAVSIPNPLKANNFYELLGSIIDLLYYISIPITALMIIMAGFLFITAEGDPTKIERAKTLIKWALIGFMIVIAAKGIVYLMMQIFVRNSGGI